MTMGTKINMKIFVTILSLCGISTSCPSVCSCNKNQTDCSDLNQIIPMHFILVQLPSNLTFLTLSKNNFTTVEPQSFSNFSDLLHLDLSRNHLSTLHPSSFSHLNSLEFLDLSENLLVMLPVKLFFDLRRLKELVLKQNRLKELNPGQFKGLTELKRLDLSLNSLSSLPQHLLHELPNLMWLSFVANKLRTLQRDALEQTTALQYLLLEGNPWNCSCTLIPFRHLLEWILYRGGYVDSINCSSPTNLIGKDLRDIPTEMFNHCYSPYLKIRNLSPGESQAGSTEDGCLRQHYRPVSVRRATATMVVAGVVCGVVCVLMVVTASYGCIYAMLAAHEQQQLKQGNNHQQTKVPEQDLMKKQEEDLMPSFRTGADASECAGWMAFPPEVCV